MRVLKRSRQSVAVTTTAPSVTVTRQTIQLRSIPRMDPAQSTSAQLRNFMFAHKPPEQDLWRSRYGRALNLDIIENSLRAADWGNMRMLTDLSRETIDTDPHLAAVLNKRFGAISALPWEVLPAEGIGVDKEKATFYADVVRNQLKQLPDFGQRIHQLAWGLFDGRAALENVWALAPLIPNLPTVTHPKFGSVNWLIKDLGWIHPRRIHFGPERELRVYDQLVSASFAEYGIALRDTPLKFIYWTPQLFGDYPEREGLARRCLYWSFFKRFSARERMILLELFGKPWRWAEVEEESSAGPEDLAHVDQMLQLQGGSTSFRMPRGVKFKVEQPGEGAGEVHQATIEDSDKQISKLVLGQTGTTDANPAGLNNAQANVMQDEQFMILMRDSRMVSEVLESYLTDAIIELNFGPQELNYAPHFRLRADVPLDRGKELDRLINAVKAGLEVSLIEAYDLSGFRMPKEDEPIIKLETPPVHPLAVQPNPERPVIVWPKTTPLIERKVQPIAPAGEGGLPSPTERATPGGGLLTPKEEPSDDGGEGGAASVAAATGGAPPARPPIDGSKAAELTFRAATRGLEHSHPSDLALVRAVIYHQAGALVCGSCSGHVSLEGLSEEDATKAIFNARQPEEKVVGSLETLIGKGVKEGARELEKLAEIYANAVRDLEDAKDINQALDRTHDDVDIHGFSRSIERRIMHAIMAGAIANQYEFETETVLAPTEFERAYGPRIILATPPTDPDFVARPLQEAIKWFRERAVVTRSVWDRLEAAAKRRAFTVAGMANNLMLQKAKDALEAEVRTGGQLRNFFAAIKERFESAGFTPANPSHVETIYRTNVLNAYNSGRHAQATQPSTLRMRPYWQIRTVNDGPPRQRPTHQAVHLWVLSATDSFWQTAYPPFGFNCRCRVVTLSEVEVKARDLRVRSGGEVMGLPDPGFTSGTGSLL